MTTVAVVYHSVGGRTRALAEAVARGAEAAGAAAALHAVGEADHAALLAADAIVFGCPTYMGSASAAFKAFMDGTSAIWALQAWRDKLAAAFTHSAAPSGDKLGTLTQLAVFAAQHGMIWIGLGLPPTYAAAGVDAGDTNRLGSHLGAMAQSAPAARGVPESDLATAELLGRRVAEAARRWAAGAPDADARRAEAAERRRAEAAGRAAEAAGAAGAAGAAPAPGAGWAARAPGAPPAPDPAPGPDPARHPTTSAWRLPRRNRPPLPAPLERANLRELAARPDRFEHQLITCATLGRAQLEIVASSEPLPFGHTAISDEYALALPSGDPAVDQAPLRTVLADAATGVDLGRYDHRVGDLVLHPVGYLHWPGRLEPPYAPVAPLPGARRCGLTLVLCASHRMAAGDAPALLPPPGRAGDLKAYTGTAPPMLLAQVDGAHGTIARIGTTELVLVERRAQIGPARGAWVIVLDVDPETPYAPCDLIRVPANASLDARGITRALVLADPVATPDPAPPSWQAAPPPPFAPFEDAPAGVLPFRRGALTVEASRAGSVVVTVGDAMAVVPRYWLARTLYRAALHGLRLGYVETYGGLFIDDHGPRGNRPIEVGLRTSSGRAWIAVPRADALRLLEHLYRAVAPPGYVERLR